MYETYCLIMSDIFLLLRQLGGEEVQHKYFLMNLNVMSPNNIEIGLFLVLFKCNQDMISCFSKIDEIAAVTIEF